MLRALVPRPKESQPHAPTLAPPPRTSAMGVPHSCRQLPLPSAMNAVVCTSKCSARSSPSRASSLQGSRAARVWVRRRGHKRLRARPARPAPRRLTCPTAGSWPAWLWCRWWPTAPRARAAWRWRARWGRSRAWGAARPRPGWVRRAGQRRRRRRRGLWRGRGLPRWAPRGCGGARAGGGAPPLSRRPRAPRRRSASPGSASVCACAVCGGGRLGGCMCGRVHCVEGPSGCTSHAPCLKQTMTIVKMVLIRCGCPRRGRLHRSVHPGEAPHLPEALPQHVQLLAAPHERVHRSQHHLRHATQPGTSVGRPPPPCALRFTAAPPCRPVSGVHQIQCNTTHALTRARTPTHAPPPG